MEVIAPLKAILSKYNISYKYEEDITCVIPSFKYSLQFYLYEDNPNFENVRKEVEQFLLPRNAGTIFEKVDFEKADWFIASTGKYQYPQPEDDYLHATFNLDKYCGSCGMGHVQHAPYRLKTEPKQHNNQFWGLHWMYEPIFVRQETKNILESENISGISFSSVLLHKKNIEIKGFYQLQIHNILAEGFDSYNTKKITCKPFNEENCNMNQDAKCCGRVKYHHPMIGGYRFVKEIFEAEYDIAYSNEYFGSGASANRIAIVSKHFKQIVDRNKLKGLHFTPVVHERIIRHAAD